MSEYWCHSCSRIVYPITDLDIKCPLCDGGFVEEIESQPDDPSIQRALRWVPVLLHTIDASRRRNAHQSDDVVHVFELAQRLRALVADDEDEGRGVGEELRLARTGFDLLLQQMNDNEQGRIGTPPARKETIEALPTIRVHEKSSCPVCLEELDVGEEGKAMPCKHLFHGGCLLPWLEMHGSCPVCRHELAGEGSSSSGEVGGRRSASTWAWLRPLNSLFSGGRNRSDSEDG